MRDILLLSNHTTFPRLLVNDSTPEIQDGRLAHADWERILQLSRRGNLSALLYYQVKGTGVEIPADCQETLHARVRRATATSLRQRAELADVLTALNTSGIVPILFKGAILAHTVYPSYTHRSMGDIDLWVLRGEMEQAKVALESLGYRYSEKKHRSHAMQALGDGELQMRGQTSLLGLVELHYGVFAGEWLRIVTGIDRAAVYNRLVAHTILEHPVLGLAAEDAFIQIALHVCINHQMTINGLRSLVDLEFLARQGLDWQTIAQRCQEWRVYTAVSFVIHLWHQLFASEQSLHAAAALPFRRHRLLKLFVGPQDLVEGHDLAQNRWRLLYQLLLVDRGRDALKLIAHTLWPDQAWLKARYSDTHAWTRLQHFRQVVSGKV
jgi:hypothetical protein